VVGESPGLWGFTRPAVRYRRHGAVRPSAPHKERRLQRFFSTFPGGWPAAGLVLLRSVAGLTAAGLGGAHLAQEPTVMSSALGAIAILSGLGLVAGFLTPIAAAAASLSTLLIAAVGPVPIVLGRPMDEATAALVAVDAIALAMLGPGAHSIDAYLFGRREIVIHDEARRRPEP
jgi:uncharacterized membrane protein YphA (DoxX/SURF4 family)